MKISIKNYITIAMITLVLVISSISSVSFASSKPILLYINGVQVNFVAEGMPKPFINNTDRTLVPIRVISEKMGYDVTWDASTRMATLTKDGNTMEITADKSTALINGKEVPVDTKELADGTKTIVDTKAIIKENRTFVPLRFVAENFGYTVGWKDNGKEYVINLNNASLSTQLPDNIATTDYIQKLAKDYGFKSNGPAAAFYNSQLPDYRIGADITVGTDLKNSVTFQLLNWEGKTPDYAKAAFETYLPTQGDKLYFMVDEGYNDRGDQYLDKYYNLDGHRVYLHYYEDAMILQIGIYNK